MRADTIYNLSDMFSDYNRTSDGWLEWEGSQYYISTEGLSMEEARQSCRKKHSDLVTINSAAENVFLLKQVSSGM